MPFNKDQYGNVVFNPTAPTGTRVDILTPNWCDKTTWYDSSIRVTDEIYTDSGDQLTYNPATTRHCVDVAHGKITGERSLRSTYAVSVTVDSISKTENSPGQGDNDYTFNYTTGALTFNSAQTGGAVVKVSYNYIVDSTFRIKPAPGKLVRLTQTEVQFSENIVLNDSVVFQLYVGGSPYGNSTIYQTMMDYVNEASLAYPSVPVMGGAGWRGLNSKIHIFRWPYSERGTIDLRDSQAAEIRISLENHTEFGGDVAVATFYGISQDEN